VRPAVRGHVAHGPPRLLGDEDDHVVVAEQFAAPLGSDRDVLALVLVISEFPDHRPDQLRVRRARAADAESG